MLSNCQILWILGESTYSQPLIEGCKVRVGEALRRRDVVEEGSAAVVCCHPIPIGVGDLVVDPGERASGRPVHQDPGLPAESEPLVLALALVGWLRPVHHRQPWQPDPRRYLGVGFVFPGGGPDQVAR